MYKYRFWQFDYECSMDVILQHEKLFTKDEFKTIVLKCNNEVKDQLDKNIQLLAWLGQHNEDWNNLTDEELTNLNNLNGDWDVISQTIKRLISCYGFTDVKDEVELLFDFDKNVVED